MQVRAALAFALTMPQNGHMEKTVMMKVTVRRRNRFTGAVTSRVFPNRLVAAFKVWTLNHAKGNRGFAWVAA